MKQWPIALQVYSVRQDAQADFAGTMRKIKDMGYDGVELAGTYDLTVAQAKKVLDEVGLELVSAHVPMDQLEDDAVLAAYAATGMKFIAIPWLVAPKDEQELSATIQRIRAIALRCKALGMQLLYHNHDFEFGKIGGKYILDTYYSEIPADLLQTELDAAQNQQNSFQSRMEEELESYRRAERTERLARQRAEQLYAQANGALGDATAKVDEAASQIGQLSDRVITQLTELQNAVFGSKQALRDAAATMYTIRPTTDSEV